MSVQDQINPIKTEKMWTRKLEKLTALNQLLDPNLKTKPKFYRLYFLKWFFTSEIFILFIPRVP